MLTFAYQEHLKSYYFDSRNLILQFPTITANQSADVCIIGAGFLGLSTALELAEQGKKVIVLEGARVGFGASGRSGGQAINGFEEGIDEYIAQVGLEKAQKLWQMSLEAIDIIDQRVNQHAIQCDWRKGYATLALNERRMNDLLMMENASREIFDYSYMQIWDKQQLKQHLGSDIYVGGLFDSHSGHLHPLNYCLGLAKACVEAGVTIYEHSPATEVMVKSDTQAVVFAEKMQISCQHVVLATNAYIDALSKKITFGIEKKILPVESFIIATEPLDQSMADSLINNGMSVCDNNLLLDYYRLSADNRLLFGSDSSSNVDMVAQIRAEMLAVFPQLAEAKIDYGWAGPIDMTLNSTPHFGRAKKMFISRRDFLGMVLL
ncbi:NAD(P)/FAD-dependent oxidoreductase [[Haemophilus] ducreyi]|uniref:NAD(P)/FAD-dependent oxidoreductase n=1 Tax=Haemophilus ducreyi TaxID=730 RepID=UPI000A6B927C|nr:gamma-Glu-putrescine oxidase, FAD/NAD(P)-binding [[Haemophilus] ducreyi]